MQRRGREETGIASLREALDLSMVDELKPLLSLLPTEERPTRKSEIIDVIENQLLGHDLHALFDRLDELQRKAVAETIYSDRTDFVSNRFKARYGALPRFRIKNKYRGYREDPSLLQLFFYTDNRLGGRRLVIPDDLKQLLLEFVPAPEPLSLTATVEPPEFIERIEWEWVIAEEEQDVTIISGSRAAVRHLPKKARESIRRIPLVRRDTEIAAQQELMAVLRLLDKGRVMVSDKTFQPSAATMDELTGRLLDGDFYEIEKKEEKLEEGPIKAFAWPMLLQAAKLVELQGKKLALTRAGRNALGAPPHETLRMIWRRWVKSTLLDEFNRICAIKGQQGKGKRGMTAPEDRRTVIVEALRQCPEGKWVRFDDFSRFMQAAALTFEVTRDPWGLYISDPQYGSLGYDGYHGWNMLQERYLLVFLFEYVATLGLIDVAYTDPGGARRDYKGMWGGIEDLDYLSRYDGLISFRLNSLGAFCLDLIEKYSPSRIATKTTITALPSLQLNVSGELSPDESLLLETYADKESEQVWRLSREKSVAAIESGNQIKELREFLQERDDQPLPETLEGFIITTERHARALKNSGLVFLIECANAEIADLIANHERAKKLCQRAGKKNLLVKVEAEEQFRMVVHMLGYGMPRV